MRVRGEEEFEYQHKGNSKIHHHNPAHGNEGPTGGRVHVRLHVCEQWY